MRRGGGESVVVWTLSTVLKTSGLLTACLIIKNNFDMYEVETTGEIKMLKTRKFEVLEYLKTEKDIDDYLNVVLEEGDYQFLPVALADNICGNMCSRLFLLCP